MSATVLKSLAGVDGKILTLTQRPSLKFFTTNLGTLVEGKYACKMEVYCIVVGL